MKLKMMTPTGCLLLAFLLSCSGRGISNVSNPGGNPTFSQVQARFQSERLRQILEAVSWTLQNTADPIEIGNHRDFFKQLRFLLAGNESEFNAMGGIPGFSQKGAEMLGSNGK